MIYGHYTVHCSPRGEVKRSREGVIEISHFLDMQREQFEDLHTLLLNAVASLMPSEEEHSETKQKPQPQTAVPQQLAKDSKDPPATNTVRSETSTADAAADANSAVEPETKGETKKVS
jgi:DNA replication initiation complex subunit (GINS family)